jgi:hypothetical protein
MSASNPEALRLEIAQLKAENERLRQSAHLADTDAVLAAVQSAKAES